MGKLFYGVKGSTEFVEVRPDKDQFYFNQFEDTLPSGEYSLGVEGTTTYKGFSLSDFYIPEELKGVTFNGVTDEVDDEVRSEIELALAECREAVRSR